jgi:hypothetical protein
MQTQAAHSLGVGSYSIAKHISYAGSEETSDSDTQKRAGVFFPYTFFAKDKKLKIAAYKAVILLYRAYNR